MKPTMMLRAARVTAAPMQQRSRAVAAAARPVPAASPVLPDCRRSSIGIRKTLPKRTSISTNAAPVAAKAATVAAARAASRVPVWLIPDISQLDPTAAAAAWAVAQEFSFGTLFARASAEIGIAFLLAGLGVKLLGKLAVESMRVREDRNWQEKESARERDKSNSNAQSMARSLSPQPHPPQQPQPRPKKTQNQRVDAEAEKASAPLSPLRVALDAAACAALPPARVFFPAIAFAQAVRTATLWAQIARNHSATASTLPKASPARAAVERAGMFLGLLDDVALDAAGLAGIVFFAWFAVQWKDRVVSVALSRAAAAGSDHGGAGSKRAINAAAAASAAAAAAREKGADEAAQASAASAAHAASLAASLASSQQHSTGALERLLIPFAGLATWGIVAVACCAALGVIGVDPTPLLTVGGFGGLAIGFGAQTVTANAISGLNLYLTRPFVAGERISLLTAAGGVVATGTVERIDIMRCVVRNDSGMPLSIPNRAVGDYIVMNESRLGKGGGGAAASAQLAAAMAGRPRQTAFKVELRLSDIDKIDALAHELRGWMGAHADVSKALPFGASLSALTPWSATVGVKAHTTPQGSRRFGPFQAELLTEVAKAVKRVGADFATPP